MKILQHRATERGFSLIEIMIAAGLMGVMSLGMVSLYKMGYSGVKSVSTNDEARSITGDIASLLTSSSACLNTFGGGNPVTGFANLTAIKNTLNANVFQTSGACSSCVYGNRSVKLNSITVGGSGTDAKTNLARYTSTSATTGIALVILDWRRVGDQMGANSVPRFFTLNVTVNGSNNITGCSAIAGPTTTASSGSGTGNYIPVWTSSTALGSSVLYQSGSNVGIGTTAPGHQLALGNGGIEINRTGEPYLLMSYGGTQVGQVRGVSGGGLRLTVGAGGTEAMGLDSAGNVGIGTSTPSGKLDVAGTIRPAAAVVGAACTPLGATGYVAATGVPIYCSNLAVWTAVGGAAPGTAGSQCTTSQYPSNKGVTMFAPAYYGGGRFCCGNNNYGDGSSYVYCQAY